MSQKKVIIIGGNSSLGIAVKNKFLGKEWEIESIGRSQCDLNDHKSIRALLRDMSCDLMVCAAGIVRDTPLFHMSENVWDEVINVNFAACRECALAVIPSMLKNHSGHIIFVSSYAANHPYIGQSAYSAAKASLHDLVEEFSLRYGAYGLRFNIVMPGYFESNMTSQLSEDRKTQIKSEHRIKALNTIEITADFIYYLENKLIHTSGQIFQLDSRRR